MCFIHYVSIYMGLYIIHIFTFINLNITIDLIEFNGYVQT